MLSETERLETFAKWPHTTATHPHCSPESMAKAGFIFSPLNSFGADRVICQQCKVELFKWEAEDDPLESHRQFSPDCSFLLGIPSQSVSAGSHDRALFLQHLLISSLSHPFTYETHKGNGKKT